MKRSKEVFAGYDVGDVLDLDYGKPVVVRDPGSRKPILARKGGSILVENFKGAPSRKYDFWISRASVVRVLYKVEDALFYGPPVTRRRNNSREALRYKIDEAVQTADIAMQGFEVACYTVADLVEEWNQRHGSSGDNDEQ